MEKIYIYIRPLSSDRLVNFPIKIPRVDFLKSSSLKNSSKFFRIYRKDHICSQNSSLNQQLINFILSVSFLMFKKLDQKIIFVSPVFQEKLNRATEKLSSTVFDHKFQLINVVYVLFFTVFIRLRFTEPSNVFFVFTVLQTQYYKYPLVLFKKSLFGRPTLKFFSKGAFEEERAPKKNANLFVKIFQ